MRKIITGAALILLAAGCVKSTINLDRISGRLGLDPGIIIAAVKGEVTLGNVIKPNDTIMFDDLGLLKIVFREDSVLNYGVSDFYTSFSSGNYSEMFPVTPLIDVVRDTSISIAQDDGVEIEGVKVITGSVDYSIVSTCSFTTRVRVEFPSVDDNGSPLVDTILISANESLNGSILLDDVYADLTTVPGEPSNSLPMIFRIIPSGTGAEPPGMVTISISMEEPEYDYITGFFGQKTEVAENDTLDTGLEDLFSKVTGTFEISNPIIRVHYLNSFGLPLRIEADVTGKRGTDEVSLDRAPEDLLYPTSLTERSVESTFVIDRDNSTLPQLVSMLPEEIIFGGSGSINPDGRGAVPNIIFSDSRFKADVELEVPMEFRINNLQLTDTVDNVFLADEDGNSPLDLLSSLELRMYINNGFPLGGEVSITLYDSTSSTVMSTLSTGTFFDPAQVDAGGRVTVPTVKNATISMTGQFIEDATVADKMIVTFTLFTTGNGSQDVKIYSDYSIEFKAGLAIKASVDVNLN